MTKTDRPTAADSMTTALLLERAKQVTEAQKSESVSEEWVEIALAWLKGEIAVTAINKAQGKVGGGVYITIARALRQAYRQSRLKETR